MWEILVSNSVWFIQCVSGEFREVTSVLPLTLDFAPEQVDSLTLNIFTTLANILYLYIYVYAFHCSMKGSMELNYYFYLIRTALLFSCAKFLRHWWTPRCTDVPYRSNQKVVFILLLKLRTKKTGVEEVWREKDTGKDELCLRNKLYHKLVKCRHKSCNEYSKRNSHI